MRRLLLVFIFILSTFFNYAQTARVVGYLPSYRFSKSAEIEYCKLTHLNICFANPDKNGNLVIPDVTEVMEDARIANPDIVILISIAGGALSSQQIKDWKKYIDIPSNRPGFIKKIVNFVLDNDLDGVDVDLEWSRVTKGYSKFVVGLDAALTAEGKMLTVAFPNYTLFDNVSQAALDAFDFINIMSYDATGPWDPSNVGPHSSYAFSKKGIEFWKDEVGISSDRLNLGVPFYGFNFIDNSTVKSMTFGTIVALSPSNAYKDQVGKIYYNGINTIKKKVAMANKEVGGTMIWELGQDSFGKYSLLSTIHNKYKSLNVITSGLCGQEVSGITSYEESSFEIYPNPSADYVYISFDKNPKSLTIYNAMGQVVEHRNLGSFKTNLEVDLSYYKEGFYYITVLDEDHTKHTQKLIVN